MEKKEKYEKGFYEFNGVEFVKVEPSDDRKVPITDEAYEALKRGRSAAKKQFGHRPDISIVATAMILLGEKSPSLMQEIHRVVTTAFPDPTIESDAE